MKYIFNFNEATTDAYDWIEFTGKKLPAAAMELLKKEPCGEFVRTWRRAYYHDDVNDYRNWIIAAYAPGIKFKCRYVIYFHMYSRIPHFPGHNFSDTTGVECYRTQDEMNAALDGYISGIRYKG